MEQSTNTVSSAGAGAKLIGIYELTETILAYLPVKDLFLAQRVCKQFHHVFTSSPLLQRNVDLLPDHQSEIRSARLLPSFISTISIASKRAWLAAGGVRH